MAAAVNDWVHESGPNDWVQPENGGILKNIGAGAISALTSIPEMVMDALPGVGQARVLGGTAANLIAGKGMTAPVPQPVTTIINRGLGKISPSLNPENVTANTFPERLARGTGAGLTGVLIPGSGGFTVGNMLRNAVLGGISGAGAATGAEIAPERFKPAAAMAGAVLAPMGAVGALNAGRAALNYGRNAAAGFTAAGPQQTVGKILAEAAGGTVPEAAEAPLPGMKPSTGQATGNQGLLYLERSAEQATPEGSRLATESRTASNAAIMDAVQKIGDVHAPAAENMLDALESARDASRKTYQAAWKMAGIEDTTPLQIAPLKQDIGEYIGGLTRSAKTKVPAEIAKVFEDFGDTEPLREIQDWRSDLSTALRAARKNGDANGMRILGGIADRVDDFLDNFPNASRTFYRGPIPGTADFSASDRGPLGPGVYVSGDQRVAQKYNSSRVVAGNVSGPIYNGLGKSIGNTEASIIDDLTPTERARFDLLAGATMKTPDDFLEVLSRSVDPARIRELFQKKGFKGIEKIVDGHEAVIFDPADISPGESNFTPEKLAKYNAARAATRVHKETFAAPGSPVSTALNPKEFGASAESNTANLFIKPSSSPGAKEAWDSYVKAMKDSGDPARLESGYQAARDAFAQKFADAISGVPDAQGNVTIKPAAVSKFLDRYDHIVQSDLFTPAQRDMLERINKAAQMTARTARAGAPGGSDTFAKLSGKSWVDALIGTGAKKVARTIGASAGYATGGPFGAAAGAYGAPKVMETMLASNKEQAMKLLTQALYDPELAKTLMTPATKASANAISLPMQARIFNVLLGRKTANENSARKVNP